MGGRHRGAAAVGLQLSFWLLGAGAAKAADPPPRPADAPPKSADAPPGPADAPPSAEPAPPPAAPDPAYPELPPGDLRLLERDLERFGPESGPSIGESYDLGSMQVQGDSKPEPTAGTEFRVEVGLLGTVPRKSAAEHLMLAPGVLTTNVGGEGHAQETFMRGFAAGEGKDIEFLVDGVPINDVSNPHTHGYADLYFVPAEVVDTVQVAAGPFEPVQGDFAFAGTARYRLGVAERGSRVRYGFGSWNSHRALLLIAPERADAGTFGAVEFARSDGFGPNRASQRANAMGRYASDEGDWRWSLLVAGFANRFDQAGVVRQDDYAAGDIGFFGNYDPNQGGESNRVLASFRFEAGPRNSRWESTTHFGYRTMRMRENFTGWLLDPDAGPGAAQRGDGLELHYDVLTMGTRGSYEMSGEVAGQAQSLSVGWAARYDRGSAGSARLRTATGIPWDTQLDREFDVANIAGWLQAELAFTDWLRLRGGARIDTFLFGVTDIDKSSSDRDGVRVPQQRAASMGYALNPRATLEIEPVEDLVLTTSYGQGTRSTEAAALSDNETAPFARSQQVEAGLRYAIGQRGQGLRLEAQTSYVFAEVTRDLLFDEAEGRNVLIGATTRHAALLGLRAQWDGWLDVLANVGWARAFIDATGETLPYIPEWVVRLDAAASGPLFDWQLGGVPVAGRLGLGFTFVPGRPLPLGTRGDDFWLANLGGEIRLWHASLGFEIRNLFDQRYRQSEFNYASNFVSPAAPPSRLPVRHFVAGEPFFAMATLTLHLEDALAGP